MNTIQITIDQILQSSLTNLQNTSYILNLIRRSGIIRQLDSSFINEEDIKYTNQYGCSSQKPAELAPFLVFLSNFSIKSYIEIGISGGGTIALISAYLYKFNPDIKICALDINGYSFPKINIPFKVENIHGTSDALRQTSFDLCFIDGDHSYGWGLKDWNNIGRYAKLCAFHDINDKRVLSLDNGGVAALWDELRRKYNTVEFSSPPSNSFGIGLIWNS